VRSSEWPVDDERTLNMHPRRDRYVAALLLAVLAAGCGGGRGGPDDPDGFRYEAARACSEVLNERDDAAVIAGQEAALSPLTLRDGDEVSVDMITADADALEAYAEELRTVQETLADLDPDDHARGAWDVVVASGEEWIGLLQRRAAYLRSLTADDLADVSQVRAGYPMNAVTGDPATEALSELGLVGRDCERIFDLHGVDPRYDDFVDAVATACTTVVSRRDANGFLEDTRMVLEAVAKAVEDEPVEGTRELRAALERVRDEWIQTGEDLAGIDATDSPAPDEWETTMAMIEDRRRVAVLRIDALDSGEDAPNVAFRPAANTIPGPGDFDALGLVGRDCRTISS
jgi:hypothetical protein